MVTDIVKKVVEEKKKMIEEWLQRERQDESEGES